MHQNNITRSHWLLGRITKVFPSNDNVVRSAEVKLPNSSMILPSYSIFMHARKVTLNPTPYEEEELF